MRQGKSELRERETRELTEMEVLVSRLLRGGVLLSVALVLLGVVILLVTGNTGTGDFRGLSAKELTAYGAGGASSFPHDPVRALSDALHLRAYAVIAVGLLVLVLTPVLRVALTVVTFVRERDWSYVVMTLTVLTILCSALALGRAL